MGAVLQSENETSTKEEDREEIRMAEDLWRRTKLRTNEDGRCDSGPFDALEFTKLLFKWTTGRLQRRKRLKKKEEEDYDENMSLALSRHVTQGCRHFLSLCEYV